MKRRRASATIADIGRDLGLSAMTVSRALNGSRDVSEETRRRVLSHAQRLNYRPNRWARSLVNQTSQIIGIIVPDISHIFFSEITRAVQEAVEGHGYDLMLCHTHGDVVREEAAVEMLLGSRADGLIVASQRPEKDPGIFAELAADRKPFVLLDRFFPGLQIPSVRTDDIAVGEIATRHLLDLGHRCIAHITGTGVSVGRQRMEGYVRALEQAGACVNQDYIAAGGFRFDHGYAAMQQLLRLRERPTAVFAVNDPCAIGAIRACADAGLRVPEDVSIIGAGAVEGVLTPCPFVTTIDWSRDQLGRDAAELLLAAIRNEALPEIERIASPQLIVRKSTAPISHESFLQCASTSS